MTSTQKREIWPWLQVSAVKDKNEPGLTWEQLSTCSTHQRNQELGLFGTSENQGRIFNLKTSFPCHPPSRKDSKHQQAKIITFPEWQIGKFSLPLSNAFLLKLSLLSSLNWTSGHFILVSFTNLFADNTKHFVSFTLLRCSLRFEMALTEKISRTRKKE